MRAAQDAGPLPLPWRLARLGYLGVRRFAQGPSWRPMQPAFYAFWQSTTSRDRRELPAALGKGLSRAKVSRSWRRSGQLGVEQPVHVHDEIAHLRVSAHFLVRRDGSLVQFVPVQMRAWHAGVSRWRGAGRCNDFSIGVELEGTDRARFADAQYRCLARLMRALAAHLPLRAIAAHSDVAPERKTDPGARFDWPRCLAAVARA